MQNNTAPSQSPLARKLSLTLITLYGVGTILGAGIYVLAGKVAGESGLYTPHAFVLASIIVAFSAHAYARLSRRFPISSGPAGYVDEVLGNPMLARITGWAILFTGIVSSATIARGFAGYIAPYLPVAEPFAISLLILTLTLLALWGVAEAVSVAGIFTLLEVTGIGLVLWLAAPLVPDFIRQHPEVVSLPPSETWTMIGVGAFLAFYAFIGFEDIVNMAEEVKRPQRNLPLAIYLSLIITTLLYFATALAFMALLPLDVFIGSDAPFADVALQDARLSLGLITFISVAAITNGALIQMIMGSRVLYGMACRGLAPAPFARVWHRTHTPVLATLLVAALVLSFALLLPITTLARLTSSIVLLIFCLVNTCLWVLEWRERLQQANRLIGFIRLLIPSTGLALCLLFLALQLW